ncbi:MAG: DoxX family protein [Candidatus Omnitrophica bacterium]|nr:DoxX family protein [Candidatus Omnitrophota bacterium]
MDPDAVEGRRDLGLLVLRLGLGFMFAVVHGGPKLLGGPERWSAVGSAMGSFGIHAAPAAWGFLAAVSECVGGLCLMTGLLVRPAAGFMAATMAVAAAMHLAKGDGIQVASHAIEDGIVFVSLILIGAGRYTVARVFSRPAERPHYTLPS